MKAEDLDAQDKLSYDKLAVYVKSLSPTKCVDVDNNFLFDDKGEHLFVPRLINTKELLECSSDEEALRLLGRGRSCNFMFVLLSRGLIVSFDCRSYGDCLRMFSQVDVQESITLGAKKSGFPTSGTS